MWAEINGAKNIDDLRMALYVVCCRIQDLESRVNAKLGGRPRKPKRVARRANDES